MENDRSQGTLEKHHMKDGQPEKTWKNQEQINKTEAPQTTTLKHSFA